MRTPRQILYDNIYYKFERYLNRIFRNRDMRRKYRGVKFDKSFYDAYKNEICPYWAQFGIKPKIYWFKHFYTITGSLDPRYIPIDLHYYYIIPHFNDLVFVRPLADKNLHNLVFPYMKRPETLYKRIRGYYHNDDFSPISQEDAFSRLQQEGSFVIKPTMYTGQGHDIQFFNGPLSSDARDKLLAPYQNADYIIQHIVKQHPDIAAFNASSLNTIRIITLVFKGKPYILSSILRIGHEGSRVDNVSQGGYQAIILPDGTLAKQAVTYQGSASLQVEQTESGKRFEGFVVPSWENLRDTALNLASKLPHLQLIGWDFAVDEQGDVVLIEFNTQPGQNQGNCGPTYGDMTDEVLEDVFGRKK